MKFQGDILEYFRKMIDIANKAQNKESLTFTARKMGVPVDCKIVTVKEFLENGTTSDLYTIITHKNGDLRCEAHSPVTNLKYEDNILSWSDRDGDPEIYVYDINSEIFFEPHEGSLVSEYTYTVVIKNEDLQV